MQKFTPQVTILFLKNLFHFKPLIFFSLLKRIWDLMQPISFENKQFRIKEESQRLIIQTLNEYVFFFKSKIMI